MTIISIAGVAVGVAILISVLSVMGGFAKDLNTRMLTGSPHLEVLGKKQDLGFSLDDVSVDKVRQAMVGATSVAPFTSSDVVSKHGKHLAAITLIGVDMTQDNSMWAFTRTMVDGKLDDIRKNHLPLLSLDNTDSRFAGIAIGEGVAGQLGVDIGSEITVLSPQAASGAVIFSGGTISRTFVVTGIFATRMFDYDDRWAVVRLSEGRKFMADYDPSLDLENFVTGIAINLEDPMKVGDAKNVLKKVDPNLSAISWQDTNSALLFALQLEKYTMAAILTLIVLVAAFSISGTMMMTVFHKKTQVCLLRSLGMNRGDIMRLFITQGLLIGIVGTLLGLVVGLGFCLGLDHFRSIDMPSSLDSIRNLPVRYLPVEYAFICLTALALTVVGAVYPAIIASRQNPSSGLRYS